MCFSFDILKNTRSLFKAIIERSTLEELNTIPMGFNNNIIWNIGHIIVSEQLLTYKLSGITLNKDIQAIVDLYRKDTKPQHKVSQEEVNNLKKLLFTTIEQTVVDYGNGLFKNYTPYTVSTTGNTLENIDDALQFIAVHEGIHYGYVQALLRALK